jgi:acyl dehydratase
VKFGELVPGLVVETGSRAVTEREIIQFATRYDPQPFHTDPARAAQSRWGGIIASGWLTCCIAMELVVHGILTGSESSGSPGIQQIEWIHPVRPGDDLHVVVTVLESRVSSSGRVGIVRWRWAVHNQLGTTVLRMISTSFFDLDGAASPKVGGADD